MRTRTHAVYRPAVSLHPFPRRAPRRGRLLHRKGFLLLTSLLMAFVLSTLIWAWLLRSTSELQTAERTLAVQQAFFLAEGGLDAKLAALRADSNDLADIELNVPAFGSYAVTTQEVVPGNPSLLSIISTGTQAATSLQQRIGIILEHGAGGGFPILGAITIVGEELHGLHDFIPMSNGGSPQLGTVFLNGCDETAGVCLPALTLTSQQAFQDALTGNPFTDTTGLIADTLTYAQYSGAPDAEDYRVFGSHFLGARADTVALQELEDAHITPIPEEPAHHYSLHRASPEELSLLEHWYDGNASVIYKRYQWLQDLATWARAQAQANGCYINQMNDENYGGKTTNNLDPTLPAGAAEIVEKDPDVEIKGTPNPITLGTSDNPKVCFIDYPYPLDPISQAPVVPVTTNSQGEITYDGSMNVKIGGGSVSGAGLLVVNAEFEVESNATFVYDGAVVIVGPSAEFEFEGNTTVTGGILMGTTQALCPTLIGCWSEQLLWNVPELNMYGAGDVHFNFDLANIQSVELLLQSGSSPFPNLQGTGSGGVKVWNTLLVPGASHVSTSPPEEEQPDDEEDEELTDDDSEKDKEKDKKEKDKEKDKKEKDKEKDKKEKDKEKDKKEKDKEKDKKEKDEED